MASRRSGAVVGKREWPRSDDRPNPCVQRQFANRGCMQSRQPGACGANTPRCFNYHKRTHTHTNTQGCRCSKTASVVCRGTARHSPLWQHPPPSPLPSSLRCKRTRPVQRRAFIASFHPPNARLPSASGCSTASVRHLPATTHQSQLQRQPRPAQGQTTRPGTQRQRPRGG